MESLVSGSPSLVVLNAVLNQLPQVLILYRRGYPLPVIDLLVNLVFGAVGALLDEDVELQVVREVAENFDPDGQPDEGSQGTMRDSRVELYSNYWNFAISLFCDKHTVFANDIQILR